MNACTVTEVANSNKATTGSIIGNTGDKVQVDCNVGYSGSAEAVCGTDGNFSTVTCKGNQHVRTVVFLYRSPIVIFVYFSICSDVQSTCTGTGTLAGAGTCVCDTGYTGTPSWSAANNTWENLTCTANACTVTEVANSNKATTGSIIGNTGDKVQVDCNVGYSGSAEAVCGTDGNFSTVTCKGNQNVNFWQKKIDFFRFFLAPTSKFAGYRGLIKQLVQTSFGPISALYTV